jgi:hypothetical protein
LNSTSFNRLIFASFELTKKILVSKFSEVEEKKIFENFQNFSKFFDFLALSDFLKFFKILILKNLNIFEINFFYF